MHFKYCPHCGTEAIQKEIGDEGKMPYCNQCKIPQGSIAWQLVKKVIE